MDLQTWVSLAAIAVFAIGLFTYLDKKFDKIDARFERIDARFERSDARSERSDVKIDTIRDELIAKIDTTRDELRDELKSDLGNLTTVVLRLDERVYDLATGNRPRPLIVPPH